MTYMPQKRNDDEVLVILIPSLFSYVIFLPGLVMK
jgi:hypothetical protein